MATPPWPRIVDVPAAPPPGVARPRPKHCAPSVDAITAKLAATQLELQRELDSYRKRLATALIVTDAKTPRKEEHDKGQLSLASTIASHALSLGDTPRDFPDDSKVPLRLRTPLGGAGSDPCEVDSSVAASPGEGACPSTSVGTSLRGCVRQRVCTVLQKLHVARSDVLLQWTFSKWLEQHDAEQMRRLVAEEQHYRGVAAWEAYHQTASTYLWTVADRRSLCRTAMLGWKRRVHKTHADNAVSRTVVRLQCQLDRSFVETVFLRWQRVMGSSREIDEQERKAYQDEIRDLRESLRVIEDVLSGSGAGMEHHLARRSDVAVSEVLQKVEALGGRLGVGSVAQTDRLSPGLRLAHKRRTVNPNPCGLSNLALHHRQQGLSDEPGVERLPFLQRVS